MKDSKEQNLYDVIPTPDQMIANAFQYRQEMLDLDLKTPSYFVRGDDDWKVIYNEESGLEENNARDDNVIALLRLAEGVMTLNKNPRKPNYKKVSLGSFIDTITSDNEVFGSLNTQMSCDPVLTCMVLARLEDIFEIPIEEKVFTGIQDELVRRIDVLNDSTTTLSPDIVDESKPAVKPKRHKIRRRIGGGALVGVLLLVACESVTDFDGETGDTLIPIEDKADTTTIADTTTTLEFTNVECVINDLGQIVVEEGHNLIQISEACGVTLAELTEWNGLTDVNDIKAGQILIVTPPTTTTTILQPIIPAETVLVETVPAETAPVETAPPVTELDPVESAPPATSSPVITLSNDVFLSEELCGQYGGSPHPFELGETLTEFLITLGLTPEQAYIVSGSEELMSKFMLDKVTASTKGLPAAECVPLWPAMKHLFASNT